jgi:hypothetical protein
MRAGIGPCGAAAPGATSPVGSFGPLADTGTGADPVSH